jgi:hypothetical protein
MMRRELMAMVAACALVCSCSEDAPAPVPSDPDKSPADTHDSSHEGVRDAAKPAVSTPNERDASGSPRPSPSDAATSAIDAGSGGEASVATSDASSASDATTPVSGVCDHSCLLGFLEKYLTALVAHDATGAPFATTLRYTDNGKEAKLGEGLWQTATSIRADTRLLFADEMTGQAGLQLVVLEGTAPVIHQARLKISDSHITELETMTVRRQGAANGFFSPDGMVPKPVFKEDPPADKRMTRAELKAEVDLYVDFLEGASGSKVHFDPKCVRFENGQQTATAGAVGSQSWSFDVTRRYLVFDEQQGIVWGMFPFSQSASALVVGEAFKVVDHKIMMIQAVMANMPAKTWM